MQRYLAGCMVVFILFIATISSVYASNIGQWEDSNRSWNDSDFSIINATLTGGGHTIEADGLISAAALSNDDMFMMAEASRTLTVAENTDLSSWINTGGILWLSVESDMDVTFSNSILAGLGSTMSFSADNLGSGSPLAAGNFATDNITNIVGQSLTLSIGQSSLLGGSGTFISDDILAVEQIGSGWVYAAGDRFLQDFSNSTAASVNGQLMLNIAAGDPSAAGDPGDTAPVPEPATVALLGIGLVGLAGAEVRRRRKKKAVDNS